jgi:hypothetical protein
MGAGGERDQHVEVRIAQLFGLKAFVRVNLRQNSAGFQPVLLRRRQDGIPRTSSERIASIWAHRRCLH